MIAGTQCCTPMVTKMDCISDELIEAQIQEELDAISISSLDAAQEDENEIDNHETMEALSFSPPQSGGTLTLLFCTLNPSFIFIQTICICR